MSVYNKDYLIDFGSWQGSEESDLKNKNYEYENLENLQSIFLTHAHFDHCGLLPKLIKSGYTGDIHCTPATRDLASIILMDSAKIQKYEKIGSYYSENDVVATMNQFRCHHYYKTKNLDNRISYTFYNAGHILGSSMIYLEIKNKSIFSKIFKTKKRILFTGDIGRSSNPIVNKPDTNMPAPEYIILESTYGDRLHKSSLQCYTELESIINETIERNGKVIIPSFAIERAQELIYHIKCLMAENKIPRIPVYIDSPMATAATGVFNIHPECFNNDIIENYVNKFKNPFSVRSLHCITDYHESIKIAKSTKPCIVISANGMCEAGRILNHLRYGVENKNNTIVIVGYMAENTLGRKILNKEKTITIENKELKLKAEVKNIAGFSAHADYSEILSWLKSVDTSKLKKIILVHGDLNAQEKLKNILEENKYSVHVQKPNEKIKL